MRRMVTDEVQKALRNGAPSPGSWNVISSINAVLQPSTLVVLTKKLGRQCPSHYLSQQRRCRVSDLANLVPIVAFDHPFGWEGLQPQQLPDA